MSIADQSGVAPSAVRAFPYLATLALCLGGILAFRILALAVNNTDLFMDEAQYWSWSLEPAFGYFSKPPLIAWIIAGATHVCGDSEFCVRLPVPLIHTATSVLVFHIGAQLYTVRTGFWSALVFATLPGISFSSGIISTDVPLLFAWALALAVLIGLSMAPSLVKALALGLALGIGLNAKYAMIYFVPSVALFWLVAPEKADLFKRRYLWISLAVGLALIVPNLLWNGAHGFATLSHTAANTGWSANLLHPVKAAEFFAAQFGVFGPILFGALLVIVWRSRRSLLARPLEDRLLLAFSVPLVGAITIQGLLSHAFANWAAPAYLAATVLVTHTMIREGSWGWLKASFFINATIAVLIAIGTWQAGNFEIPGIGDPFARTLGSRQLARSVRGVVKEGADGGAPFGTIITDDREITAALLYYAPEVSPRVRSPRRAGPPRDHYELTRPLTASDPEPILLVARKAQPDDILKMFASVRSLGQRELTAGEIKKRKVHFYALAGLRGQ
jgi:4-amino-4-deoxy-L-arabinose transferase-like glycosyltransferase